MNIEEFYEADERRRESQELEFGNEWHDASGNRFDASYVVTTGELYVMSAPDGEVYEDTFGDVGVLREPLEALSVEVLGVVADPDVLHRALTGWEQEMAKPNSLEWLRARVREAIAG